MSYQEMSKRELKWLLYIVDEEFHAIFCPRARRIRQIDGSVEYDPEGQKFYIYSLEIWKRILESLEPYLKPQNNSGRRYVYWPPNAMSTPCTLILKY